MKRAGLLNLKNIFIGLTLSISILFTVLAQPAFAAVLFTSDVAACSGYGHGPARVEDQSLTIPSPAAISTFVLRVNQITGEASARIRVYDDNSNNPGNLLGTFTYLSSSGNLITYSGSALLPAAGKYWLRFSTTAQFWPCYNFNPTFTGSLSGWSVGKVRESVDYGSTFTERTDNMSFLYVINGSGGGSGPISSTLSVTASSIANFRQAVAATATLGFNGSQGNVTFYANGKRIAGCINQPSSGLSASCTWKPSSRGSLLLTAKLTPTDTTFAPVTSAAVSVRVVGRSNIR